MRLNQRGSSLIEVSVAMSVIAILLGLAIPQFNQMGTKLRERATVSELASEIRMARMLAVSKQMPMDVRLSPDGQRLTVTAGSDPDAVLRSYTIPTGSVNVSNWPTLRDLRFQPSGRSSSPMTITLQGRDGQVWNLSVSMTGRVGLS